MAVNEKRFGLDWFELDEYKKKYLEHKLDLDDIESIIDLKFNRILSKVYSAAKDKFDNDAVKYKRDCQFLLQGNDIMIDDNGKFWMLEVNQTPTMFKDHDKKIKDLMKNIVKEAIDIVMEIRDLKLNGVDVDQYVIEYTKIMEKRLFGL